jgi:hypothetical protein
MQILEPLYKQLHDFKEIVDFYKEKTEGNSTESNEQSD